MVDEEKNWLLTLIRKLTIEQEMNPHIDKNGIDYLMETIKAM
jgi:hypothetical protein